MTMPDIDALKSAIRVRLRRDFAPVPSARESSEKVHLEVWQIKRGSRVVGVEFGHEDRVNFWLVQLGMPRALPSSIERVDKDPMGQGWTDASGKGANSNLLGYKEFVKRPIARLAIKNIADGLLVLEHLSK